MIEAEEDSVFLDIISPPYDDHGRECTYYKLPELPTPADDPDIVAPLQRL